MSGNSDIQYEVLSPWAMIDPIPLRGSAQRLDSLDGRTIGLFKNFKRAAGPVLEVVERELQSRYPQPNLSGSIRMRQMYSKRKRKIKKNSRNGQKESTRRLLP